MKTTTTYNPEIRVPRKLCFKAREVLAAHEIDAFVDVSWGAVEASDEVIQEAWECLGGNLPDWLDFHWPLEDMDGWLLGHLLELEKTAALWGEPGRTHIDDNYADDWSTKYLFEVAFDALDEGNYDTFAEWSTSGNTHTWNLLTFNYPDFAALAAATTDDAKEAAAIMLKLQGRP